MKQIIFFSSFFVFSLLVSCGESIKIQEIGLEVMTKDLGKMNWEDAKKACENLGDGWRLPTIEELEKIYEYRDKIGGFEDNSYWSSTETDYGGAWFQNFGSGDQYIYGKDGSDLGYVRAVRALHLLNY